MHVSVVNSYAAASDSVPVSCVSREDLPTDGKPGEMGRQNLLSQAAHANIL